MNAERWARLDEVFSAAIGLPPEARGAYVAEACGTGTSLRAEVERLLAAHERAGRFIETPALATPGVWPDDEE